MDPDILARFKLYGPEGLEEKDRPRANPMFLDFETPGKSRWNEAVCSEFLFFMRGREDELLSQGIPLPNRDERHEIFFNRFGVLKRTYKDIEARDLPDGTMETLDQVRDRVSRTDQRRLDEARRHTRRREVLSQSHKAFQPILTKLPTVAVSHTVRDHKGEHVQC